MPTPSTAAVMAATNEGLDWLEFCPSDDAQQLSAWACVRTRSAPERCESRLVHWAFAAFSTARHPSFRARQPPCADRGISGHQRQGERES